MEPMGTPSLARAALLMRRAAALENRACARANRLCRLWPVEPVLRAASRLGDGLFWYALIAWIPFGMGMDYLHVSVRMALAGVCGVAVYSLIKRKTARPRPYVSLEDVTLLGKPLDRYSFPSGHTLHAVSFTVIVVGHVPQLAPLLVPFAVLVALSRVCLGLHYPTDVIAGALLGAIFGSLALLPL